MEISRIKKSLTLSGKHSSSFLSTSHSGQNLSRRSLLGRPITYIPFDLVTDLTAQAVWLPQSRHACVRVFSWVVFALSMMGRVKTDGDGGSWRFVGWDVVRDFPDLSRWPSYLTCWVARWSAVFLSTNHPCHAPQGIRRQISQVLNICARSLLIIFYQSSLTPQTSASYHSFNHLFTFAIFTQFTLAVPQGTQWERTHNIIIGR